MAETDLKTLGKDMRGWKEYLIREKREIDGYVFENLQQIVYRREIDGVLYSMGCFFLKEQEIYRAWGLVSEEHCSFNSIFLEDGSMSEPIAGCPNTTVSMDDSRVGTLSLTIPGTVVTHEVLLAK